MDFRGVEERGYGWPSLGERFGDVIGHVKRTLRVQPGVARVTAGCAFHPRRTTTSLINRTSDGYTLSSSEHYFSVTWGRPENKVLGIFER